MASKRPRQEELEWEELRQLELRLTQQHKEIAELPKRLAREKQERERTIPPLADIHDRKRAKRHEDEIATRGAVRNLQKTQGKSLLLLFTLLCATAALIAWGLRLMEG